MRCFFFPLSLLCLIAVARAETRIVETEVTIRSARELLARGSIAVRGDPHRWLEIYIQARLADGTALVGADKKSIMKRWGQLFTPDGFNAETTWSNCSTVLSFDWLESAVNLPKGKTSVVRIVFDAWDISKKKYVAAGHEVAGTVWIQTDANGRITLAECFSVRHTKPQQHSFVRRKPVRVCTTRFVHLKPVHGDVGLYRAVGGKHTIYDLLYWPKSSHEKWQLDLQSLGRGVFFQPPTSDDAARELALLPHAGVTVVPSADAYQALLQHMQKWPKAILVKTPPQRFGVTVRPIPQTGWHVNALVVESYQGNERVVVLDYWIDPKGRMNRKRQVLIDTGRDVILGQPFSSNWTKLPYWFDLTQNEAELPELESEYDQYLKPNEWPKKAKTTK